MKKVIAIAALMAVSVAFAACDPKTEKTGDEGTPTPTEAPATPTE